MDKHSIKQQDTSHTNIYSYSEKFRLLDVANDFVIVSKSVVVSGSTKEITEIVYRHFGFDMKNDMIDHIAIFDDINQIAHNGKRVKLCKREYSTKSSRERVNAITKPESTPGIILGSLTVKNALTGVQPRSSAASVSESPSSFILGRTERITYGRQKVVCAISIAQKPIVL